MRSARLHSETSFSAAAPPTLIEPLQVFTIDRLALMRSTGLDAARAVGWRFVSESRTTLERAPALRLVVAEVTERNGVAKFAHRQEGWLASRTRETLDLASTLPQADSGTYELRMLRLPSIATTDAIWLKGDAEGKDILIPIASRSAELVAGQPYSADDFLRICRNIAQQPTFDNSPRR